MTLLLVVAPATAGVTGAGTTDAASAYQAQEDGPADAAVSSGEVFWQGQFLELSAENNSSEVWSVRRVSDGEVGGLVTEVLLDESGSAVVSSDNLDGQFVVVNEDNEPVAFRDGTAQSTASVSEAQWEVTTQQLNATVSDVAVSNDESSDAATDLRLESNRAGYEFYLFSEDLSPEELADVFQSVEVEDDRAVSTRSAGDDDAFDANFSGVDAGTYDITVATVDGTARDSASITVSDPVEGSATFENATVEEARGDVARFTVTMEGADQTTVTVGSRDVGYLSRFTVVDENGDGEATIEINTFEAGLSADEPGITAVGEDDVTDYELQTDPVPDQLDAATYPVRTFVGGTQSDVASLVLDERSTEGVQTWTAPDGATVENASDLIEVVTQDADIAYQDLAVVQVQASGLYGYVQNASDLNDNETGVSMTLTQGAEPNVPDREIPLDRGNLLIDEDNDQFFLVFDTNGLDEGATYEANFTMTAANPYVSAQNASSYTTNFSVVERDASFDDPLEVPASSDAAVTGTSSLAPGTQLEVEIESAGADPFFERQTAEVGEDGTWEATFDLSGVSNGTEFAASIADPSANATGVVVAEGDAEAADEETTTEETETTETEDADGEETTTEADDEDGETTEEDDADEDEETETPEEDEETTTEEEAADEDEETTTEEDEGAGEDEAADETTTTEDDAAAAPAPGFGPVAVLLAALVALAGVALARRRR
ncbi:hypothetical protein NGM10_16880 (plasmid) [Halorussus salilacus]|uniref:DUF7827 domain-containing protein n=1 Tax=Halorussus salilacus TaxID=2953750 RepID=UPI00209E8575|nr:BGTF surface domain-containing protein [Halorussus salilacus]USZ69771.1 hypothetical protein NGM10_16880 [Halorussus salilacus]